MSNEKKVVETKLTVEEFTKKAIVALRVGNYKGIHTRFSGFNAAFRKYYGSDPVAAVADLQSRGIIEGHLEKGGAMIYLKGEMPERKVDDGSKTLAKIIG